MTLKLSHIYSVIYIALLSWLYHSTLFWLVKNDWSREDFNYCYLIPVIIAYLVWEKKEIITKDPFPIFLQRLDSPLRGGIPVLHRRAGRRVLCLVPLTMVHGGGDSMGSQRVSKVQIIRLSDFFLPVHVSVSPFYLWKNFILYETGVLKDRRSTLTGLWPAGLPGRQHHRFGICPAPSRGRLQRASVSRAPFHSGGSDGLFLQSPPLEAHLFWSSAFFHWPLSPTASGSL